MNISTTEIRKVYREMYVHLSQDTVDSSSTGRKSLVLTKASLSILISRSREIETINSTIIILLFPSSMRMSNQSIVNQNYIKNDDLVSTVHFAFNQRYLGNVQSRLCVSTLKKRQNKINTERSRNLDSRYHRSPSNKLN